MLRFAHSLSLVDRQCPRGIPDPLANIWRAFRFQSHDAKTLRDPVTPRIIVAGAGNSDLNGEYIQTGPYQFLKSGAYNYVILLDYEGTGQWHIYDDTFTYHYYFTDEMPDRTLESVNTAEFFSAIDGTDPGPTCSYDNGARDYRDCVIVSGAGTDAVNGRYYWNGEYWDNPGKASILEYGGYLYLTIPGEGLYYVSTNQTSLPWEAEWSQGTLDLPLPVVTLIQEPQYKPLGMYQDAACIVPATEDGHLVQGVRDYKSGEILATQANPMLAPTLRFLAGVPVLEFGGNHYLTTVSIDGTGLSNTGLLAAGCRWDSGNGDYTPLAIARADYFCSLHFRDDGYSYLWGANEAPMHDFPGPLVPSTWHTATLAVSPTQAVIKTPASATHTYTIPPLAGSGVFNIGADVAFDRYFIGHLHTLILGHAADEPVIRAYIDTLHPAA